MRETSLVLVVDFRSDPVHHLIAGLIQNRQYLRALGVRMSLRETTIEKTEDKRQTRGGGDVKTERCQEVDYITVSMFDGRLNFGSQIVTGTGPDPYMVLAQNLFRKSTHHDDMSITVITNDGLT